MAQPFVEPNFEQRLALLVAHAEEMSIHAGIVSLTALSVNAPEQRELHLQAADMHGDAAKAWRLACTWYRNAGKPESFQYADNATQHERKAAQEQMWAVSM